MRCGYCFYLDEMHSREVANRGMMQMDTMEVIIKKALEETERACCFGFQGGEPTLLGLDFYKKAIEYQNKYNRNNVQISNSIQTNGILINDAWAHFFSRNNFLVGLSIDGNKDIHDLFRLDPQGKGTFLQCIRAINILTSNKVNFNILSVVTRQLASHPDKLWNFYKKHNFRYIQLIPCLDGLNESPSNNRYSLDIKTFGKFLCRFFDLWYKDFIQGNYYSVRTFDNYIRILMGERPENCAMSGVCQAYALVEADGCVYPCDFYALDDYKIGNIHNDTFTSMIKSETASRFIAPSKIVLEECRSCNYYFICRGGCRREREPLINGIPALNRYCGAYREFFDYSILRLMKIAKNFASINFK